MDDLIGQNPRDYLIVLREQNLRIERERKIINQAVRAETRYPKILKLFSRQFLRDDVFDTLSALQKKELDKLCASFCRRRIVLNSLPFLGSLGGIFYLSFFASPALLLLFPWIVGSFLALLGMETYCEKKKKVFFFDQIDFLFTRRKIKKVGKLKDIV